jgi:hypothetical protein
MSQAAVAFYFHFLSIAGDFFRPLHPASLLSFVLFVSKKYSSNQAESITFAYGCAALSPPW